MIATEKLKKVYTGHVWANTRNCKACWACIDDCPKHVIGKISFLWHKHIVLNNSDNYIGCKKCIKCRETCPHFNNSNTCIGCKKCIKICPYGVFSEEIPNIFKEILNKVE